MVQRAANLMLFLICVVAGLPSAEARRVALVIGNADYRIGRLANPVSDAEAVAAALETQLKLDQVILKKNLAAEGLRAALREMARESAGAELGIIYFAGHGVEVAGRNYLIPIDAALETGRDVKLEAIELDAVLEHLEGVSKLRLVILDACRNNPFPAAKRGGARGLARIEPVGGTLVAYAAKEGTTAEDGSVGRHSPFTASLLKRIVMPGVDVRRVFGYVSEDVLAATGRAQEPFLYGRLGGDEVHLLPKEKGAEKEPAGLSPGQTVLPVPSASSGGAAQAWVAAKDSIDIAVLEAFRLEYGTRSPFYDRLAEARIAELKQKTLALASPTPAPVAEAAFNPKRAAAPLTAAEERALRPKDSFKECAECPEMVVVPAGSFMMGSPTGEKGRDADEGPQHRVTIERPVAVGKFEVTFAEWDACIAAGGCSHNPRDSRWGRGRRPVIDVSWNDITRQYLPWLSRKTGKTYRLLTEAEWEYAARAGTTTRYAFGNTLSKSQAQVGAKMTAIVGSFQPNAFGLYDMHGNVWEWVQDCSHAGYGGAPLDGSAWMTGDCGRRIFRGGAWKHEPTWLRSAVRVRNSPADFQDNGVGFRVARMF